MIERFLLRLKKSARASLVDAIRGLCGLLLARYCISSSSHSMFLRS